MANMSYCRFQNTLNDLRDCFKAIQNHEALSDDEANAFRSLMNDFDAFLNDEDLLFEDGIDFDKVEDLIRECSNDI